MRTLLLFLALTLPLAAQEAKTVKLTLSPETTYLTEPQLPDGRIDYLAALNKMLSAKTTPENNLVVGLMSLIPGEHEAGIVRNPQGNSEEERQRFAEMIGCKTLPPLETLQDVDPVGLLNPLTGTYFEKELLAFYSKEELEPMIQTQREKVKQRLKIRFNQGNFTQEKYDAEIKKADEDREQYCADVMNDQFMESLRKHWSAKDYPYLAHWLATTDSLAPKLIALSQERTGYYSPQISASELFYDVQLPYVQTLRQCARYFQCRGNFEFARGNYDEAMECSFTAIRLGQTLRKNACWIVEDLIGVSMIGMGTYQLSTYLTALSGKKDAAWILQKKQEYDALKIELGYGTSVPMWCLHERLTVLCTVQAIAVNHESVRNDDFKIMFDYDNVLARYEKLFYTGIAYDWDEILRRINHVHDDMADVWLLSNWQRRLRAASRMKLRIDEHNLRSQVSSGKPEQQAVDFLIGHFGTAIEAMMMAQTRSEWGQSVTSVAFALSAYRSDNGGKSPDSLDQLVPKYLPSVPLSPFTNKPLRYIKREYEVLIASDDEYKLNGSEEEVEKKIAEAKPGEWAYPAHDHYVFVVSKD